MGCLNLFQGGPMPPSGSSHCKNYRSWEVRVQFNYIIAAWNNPSIQSFRIIYIIPAYFIDYGVNGLIHSSYLVLVRVLRFRYAGDGGLSLDVRVVAAAMFNLLFIPIELVFRRQCYSRLVADRTRNFE